jgi:hypothetical protein
METGKKRAKSKIAIFIFRIILIIAAVLLFIFLRKDDVEEVKLNEISVYMIEEAEDRSLYMPYEYIRRILNRKETLLEDAEDIEARTYRAERPVEISLAYLEPWQVGLVDSIKYIQGITSIKTIDQERENCVITFIEGYDSSYLLKKDTTSEGGYAIIPEWMTKSMASGYDINNIRILLMNHEPRETDRRFKVIGTYRADPPSDTIYASILSYCELYTYEEDKLDSLISSLSIYYRDGANVDYINNFLNDYFSDSEIKKEGQNLLNMDYDYYYKPVTE